MPAARHASVPGLGARPSSVVTFEFAALETGVAQERIATPFRCTVQAPHCARPQPNFGASDPRSFRTT
jgi:hypothetical protein